MQLQSWRDLLSEAEKAPFIDQLIDGFLSESANQLAALHDALHAGDSVTCRYLAHRLQSLCSMIGALHLMDLCAEMEVLAEANTLPRLHEQLSHIQDEYARVTQALEHERR
jgi:HPt (histidine-containing phosphotransfer) domain-containing protein